MKPTLVDDGVPVIHLTRREWTRIVQLIESEWGDDEATLLAWVRDDEAWAGDPWSKVEPL